MLFSSISFIYYFLPIVIMLYFIVPFKFKNLVLLVSSLFFYFYGEPLYSILILISSLSGYLHGLWIDKSRKSRYAKLPLICSIIFSIGILLYFKYADFFIENINWLFNLKIAPLKVVLPIGISFYTFQILSYTIDVYKGNAKVQKNYFSFAAYVSLFPQLIAGPIVRYTTVEQELSKRSHTTENFSYGISRFIVGLSKKVLIANTLGELGRVFSNLNERTILFYWIAAISFMLQIYYDFSGYSDMAIGLGRIFGFHFLENFNYPFISRSISEFWRRWHISLGTWFRDYLYIPMGGNRAGTVKWIRNVIVVWFLTGFWHGADWNFIVWGLYFGIFLTLEKFLFNSILKKLPAFAGLIYTLFFVTISFVIFNAVNMTECIESIKGMFGFLNIPLSNAKTVYYLSSYGFVLIIAAFGATPLTFKAIEKIKCSKKGEFIINVLEPIVLLSLLLLITGYLVDGSFNPFLYFRF
ncbi:MBOAT family O-acyltransferase [Sedimentibacter saalensis]|uniref:MBOAT family O-acyltransferase n=1 Tax=Sedimentibacter saalensis TaxID=130788 RepID=UPI00289CB6F3|nr:MBOAT family O-acyltransferase [Sedimentibacter saalensis]